MRSDSVDSACSSLGERIACASPGGRYGAILFADAALAKLHFRWRTALIVRELEEEASAVCTE